jgi:hypothetical protein
MVQVHGVADVQRMARHMQLGGSCKWTNVNTQQSNNVYQDNILMHLGGSLNRSIHAAKVQYLPHFKM